MSEETKQENETAAPDDIKSTVVFICGMNPHPVTKLDAVHSVRAGKMFLPAVHGKARLPDQLREYEVDFPITIIDSDNAERYEQVRKFLHDRIDEAFDGYMAKWNDIKKSFEQKKPVSLTDALKQKKAEQDAAALEKETDAGER